MTANDEAIKTKNPNAFLSSLLFLSFSVLSLSLYFSLRFSPYFSLILFVYTWYNLYEGLPDTYPDTCEDISCAMVVVNLETIRSVGRSKIRMQKRPEPLALVCRGISCLDDSTIQSFPAGTAHSRTRTDAGEIDFFCQSTLVSSSITRIRFRLIPLNCRRFLLLFVWYNL